MGFNRRLGRCTIFEAKLWGILDGLSLLQGRKSDRVLMPTYSLEVIEAIKEFNSKNSNSALIRRIYQHLKTVDHWLLQYIPREENREAGGITMEIGEQERGLPLAPKGGRQRRFEARSIADTEA
ncbi:hypothetical protein Gotur_025793 [Gossypium turneri]